MADLTDLLQSATRRILPEIIEIRRHLHQNPELSGQERETAALVVQHLRAWGLEDIRTAIGGHGVAATLGKSNNGPMLALRADMDALPIQETSGLPYQSCRAGVMHACGHDGHTATLLGVASVLSELREFLTRPVKLIFQPAEETIGGAEGMVAAGVLEDVESIIALHGWPDLEIGQIGVRSGPLMASADTFDLTVRGQGGHAAYPHTTVDPIVVGSQIVQAFQTLSSREISPLDSVVVTVTQFHAGTAYNVIPGAAELKGTVRCLSNFTRAEMPARMERMAAGICAALRADCTLNYQRGTPVVVNDPEVTGRIKAAGAEILGAANVIPLETPTMGAEDFAFYLEQRPGALFRLGVGTDVTALHTSTYNFSDDALTTGIALLAYLALCDGQDAGL